VDPYVQHHSELHRMKCIAQQSQRLASDDASVDVLFQDMCVALGM